MLSWIHEVNSVLTEWKHVKKEKNWSRRMSVSQVFNWSLQIYVPYVLTCQRALHAYLLTCQRVLRAYVLTCHTCSSANVPCVLTWSNANVSCVLTCSRAKVLCVLSCSRANVPRVLTCSGVNVLTCLRVSHATTSNNKNKFSMKSFTLLLSYFTYK